MFGQRHAGWAGQAITSSVTWIHRRSGLDYDGEEFNSLNYSDDLAGCEDGERAMVSYQKMGYLLEELGLEEAASKASPPSTEMEYLGVLFNSVGKLRNPKISFWDRLGSLFLSMEDLHVSQT